MAPARRIPQTPSRNFRRFCLLQGRSCPNCKPRDCKQLNADIPSDPDPAGKLMIPHENEGRQLLRIPRGFLIFMSKSSSINRRDLIAGATLGLAGMAQGANSDIPYRTLGHTGEKVSLVGLGGYHMG